MRKSNIFILALVVLSFAISAYFYPQLPERMASHWNAAGEVDGTMQKFWGSFLFPFLLVFLAMLFILLPKLDPMRENVESFRQHFDRFIIVFFFFMLFLQMQVLLWGLGVKISPNLIFPVLCGILFFFMGILLRHAKRNWFIGIRTPWTLSSDEVWDRTHKLGAKLFMLVGAISLIGVFFGRYAIYFLLVPIFVVIIYLLAYSYYVFHKQKK